MVLVHYLISKVWWVELCQPRMKCLSPNPAAPVDLTLFRNKVFAYVVELKGGHTGLVALNPVTGGTVGEKRGRFRHITHAGEKVTGSE